MRARPAVTLRSRLACAVHHGWLLPRRVTRLGYPGRCERHDHGHGCMHRTYDRALSVWMWCTTWPWVFLRGELRRLFSSAVRRCTLAGAHTKSAMRRVYLRACVVVLPSCAARCGCSWPLLGAHCNCSARMMRCPAIMIMCMICRCIDARARGAHASTGRRNREKIQLNCNSTAC